MGFFQDFWNKKKENSKFKINNKMKIIPSSDLQTPFWRTSDRPENQLRSTLVNTSS